jgi:hypothetical protein
MTAPECAQVDAVPMIRGNHGQTGEPAFGRLCLYDEWQAISNAKVEETLNHFWLSPAFWCLGED